MNKSGYNAFIESLSVPENKVNNIHQGPFSFSALYVGQTSFDDLWNKESSGQ